MFTVPFYLQFSFNLPFVAGTVHHARDTPIEETVTRFKSWYEERARGVVSTTAGICSAKTS